MFSLVEGTPVAAIVGGRKKKFISIAPEEEPSDPDTEECSDDEEEKTKQLTKILRQRSRMSTITLPAGEEVDIMPSPLPERMYIAGQSGCGKSTLASRYMVEYLKMFPKNKVFLFSRHEGEPTYKDVPHTAIKLNEELETTPIDLPELANSLVVFDDTDNLQDKKVSKAIAKLNDDIISNGRKYGIHSLTLAHQLLNHFKSRNILNETNRTVFFNSGTTFHIKNYLQKYIGLELKKVKKILAVPSRWTLISNGMPVYVLHQRGAFIV